MQFNVDIFNYLIGHIMNRVDNGESFWFGVVVWGFCCYCFKAENRQKLKFCKFKL
jgi:hypothetical protein